MLNMRRPCSETSLNCPMLSLTFTCFRIKDGNNILPFFPPRCFLKYDIGNKLYFERVTFYEGPHRPELLQSIKEQAEKRKLQEKSNYKSCGSIFFNFDDKNVPDGPCESVIEALERKTIPPERYTMIKEVFHLLRL